MPKAYFEPENLDALAEIYQEGKRILLRRECADPVTLDWMARRILNLADQGLPPWLILAQILPPTTAKTVGPRANSHADPLTATAVR